MYTNKCWDIDLFRGLSHGCYFFHFCTFIYHIAKCDHSNHFFGQFFLYFNIPWNASIKAVLHFRRHFLKSGLPPSPSLSTLTLPLSPLSLTHQMYRMCMCQGYSAVPGQVMQWVMQPPSGEGGPVLPSVWQGLYDRRPAGLQWQHAGQRLPGTCAIC